MILCEFAATDGEQRFARIRDLSECGIKISTPEPMDVGTRLSVRLPGSQRWLHARVVWSGDGLTGVAFAKTVELPKIAGARPRNQIE